jgi:hypothetical protein
LLQVCYAGAHSQSQFAAFNSIPPNYKVELGNEVDPRITKRVTPRSIFHKPFANDVEVIWQSKFGFGNAVYQANRYYLNNFLCNSIN